MRGPQEEAPAEYGRVSRKKVFFGPHVGQLCPLMRDAIAIVTPFEDLHCDGGPAQHGAVTAAAATAVVSAMADGDGRLLIASSTVLHNLPTTFTVSSPNATESWMICDLSTKRAVQAAAGGSAVWSSKEEGGSVLIFGAETPCHEDGQSSSK